MRRVRTIGRHHARLCGTLCGLCAGGCTQSRVHGTRARTVGPTVGEDPVFCFALGLPARGRRTGPASDRSFARRSFALTCLCTPSKVPKMAEGLCTTSSSPLRALIPTPGHPTGRYRPPLNARPCDPRKERVLTSSPEPHETSCRRNGPGRPWPSLPPTLFRAFIRINFTPYSSSIARARHGHGASAGGWPRPQDRSADGDNGRPPSDPWGLSID